MAIATAMVISPSKARKVLVFDKGYHGSTISGRGNTGKPSINLPHDFVVGKYNNVEATIALVDSLPQDSLAAILVEPMLGSGGAFVGTTAFLQTLRELATKHKALLIFDEVMTSRLSYHGLGSTYGITPDLTTLGKYLGGGMSFGAFGGRKDIMGLYDPRKGQLEHAGTFNNNVFTMNAGLAGSDLLTADLLDSLNFRGERMRSAIEEVIRKHGLLQWGTVPNSPIVDEAFHSAGHPLRPPKMFILGKGSLMVIHFAGAERDLLQGLYYHHMLEQGIYMALRGFVALSLEINDEHVEKFVQATDSFCRQWHAAMQW